MEESKPIRIAENLWWVGSESLQHNLRCNPYLYLGEGSAVLFDPGSVLDFAEVHAKVVSLIPIDSIEAIVCSHQDPDLCASLPLFEQAGFNGNICCHERASSIIRYYGVASPFYLVDHHEYRYAMKDGNQIKFLFAPYLHFPGSIMSYLEQPKALISGDLFGAFSQRSELYAAEDYEEGMKTFHEAYMPSHDILRPVMAQLHQYDISLICPQHGSIINDRIPEFIGILENLQCGIFINPIHKALLGENGHIDLCNRIIKRYLTLFGAAEVRKVFAKSPFVYDAKTRAIKACNLPESERWNAFFELIHARKGMGWITVVAPVVELVGKEYSIPLPSIFSTIVFDAMQERSSKEARLLELENQKSSLEQRLFRMEEDLFRDPVTGLFNQDYHRVFSKQVMEMVAHDGMHLSFFMISIDNLSNINMDHGSAEGDATMKKFATIVKQKIESSSQAFRLAGGTFGIYCSHHDKPEIIRRLNSLLNYIADSEAFIVPISISVGLFHTTELPTTILGDVEQMAAVTIQTAQYRLRLAQKRGGGILVHESVAAGGSNTVFTVLLIDEPGLGRNLIQRALEQERYRVVVKDNGLEGRRAIEEEVPDIIICELMVPKVNGITLRKELLAKPEARKIPYLLMSYSKNESTVGRAIEVKITHFFFRPVMLVELLGVVNLIANRLQIQGK